MSDREFEKVVAELTAYCKKKGVQAHTKIKGGSLIVVKRHPRRSRLTGAQR